MCAKRTYRAMIISIIGIVIVGNGVLYGVTTRGLNVTQAAPTQKTAKPDARQASKKSPKKLHPKKQKQQAAPQTPPIAAAPMVAPVAAPMVQPAPVAKPMIKPIATPTETTPIATGTNLAVLQARTRKVASGMTI